jgi:hypothetical protein
LISYPALREFKAWQTFLPIWFAEIIFYFETLTFLKANKKERRKILYDFINFVSFWLSFRRNEKQTKREKKAEII